MPLPAFRERLEEFHDDLRQALPNGGTPLEQTWTGLPLAQRLDVLRQFPPDERFMFTLRDACLFPDILEASMIKSMRKNGNPIHSVEYVCNGAGYITEEGGATANVGALHHCRDVVRRDVGILVERITQQGTSAEKRSQEITDHLFAYRSAHDIPPREQERDVRFRRRVFNVRLMQALVNEDVTSIHMKHMGMNPNSAVKLMKKHQGSEYRSVSVVNDALHFLPVHPTGKELATEFFRSRLSPAARLSKIRPDLVKKEIDGSARGERHCSATVVMALRAMGIEDPKSILDQDVEDERSDLCMQFRSLLRESGTKRGMRPGLFLPRLQRCVTLLRPLIVSSRVPLLGWRWRNGGSSLNVNNPVQ